MFSLSTHSNDEEPLISHGEWRLLRDELALKAPTRSGNQPLFVYTSFVDKLKQEFEWC